MGGGGASVLSEYDIPSHDTFFQVNLFEFVDKGFPFTLTGSRACWSCESVGFYRDLPALGADFAEDGSVLAVTFDSVLTLWDPDNNTLRQAFPMKSKIK